MRAGVASSVLGVRRSAVRLWIWLAAVIGLNALNMLIGVLIGCSIPALPLLMVIQPGRTGRSPSAVSILILLLPATVAGAQRHQSHEADERTPSAVSKSLAKCDQFDDPLFVKTPLGLLPTPLTVSLEQDLADWLIGRPGSSINSTRALQAGLSFASAETTADADPL